MFGAQVVVILFLSLLLGQSTKVKLKLVILGFYFFLTFLNLCHLSALYALAAFILFKTV